MEQTPFSAADAAPPGLPELRMAGEGLPPYPGRTPGRGLLEELSDTELVEAAREAWRRTEATPPRPRGDVSYREGLGAAATEERDLQKLLKLRLEMMRRRGGAGAGETLLDEPRGLPGVGEYDAIDSAVLERMDVSMAPGRPRARDLYGRHPMSERAAAEAEGFDVADLDRISEHARKYTKPPKGAERAIREAELPPMQRRLLSRAEKPSEKFQITVADSDEPMALYGIILNDGTSIRSTRGVKAPAPHTDLVTAPKKGAARADIPTQRRMDAVGEFLNEGGVRTRTNIRPKGEGRLLYVQYWTMTDEQIRALSQRLSDFDEVILDGPRSIGANIADPTAAKLRAAIAKITARHKAEFGRLPGLQG